MQYTGVAVATRTMLARLLAGAGAGRGSVLVNSAFLVANTLAGSAFGFLFWLVAARAYTPVEVGLGAAYVSAITFLTNAGEMGLGTALIRFAPAMDGRRASFINSALSAAGICTLGITLAFALGTPLWLPDMAELGRPGAYLWLFTASALAFGLAQLLDRVFIAFQMTHFMFVRNTLAGLIRLGVLLTVGRVFGAHGLVLAVGAGAALTFALSVLVFAPRAVPGYRIAPALDPADLRDKVSYTLGNHFATLLWSAPALVYPVVIVALLGAEANAHFYVSWMVANLLFIVPASVSTSAFARASNEAIADERAFWRAMCWTLADLLLPALLMVAAAPVVLGVFGDNYGSEGRWLFTMLVLSVFAYTVNTSVIAYHRIRQEVRAVVWLSGLITVLCMGLSMGLGAVYGLAGVGTGWLAGQMLGVGLSALSSGVLTPTFAGKLHR